ncbi:AcrR family transcriptional regulator [Actinoplanes lutulentus]|uniref:TetR family transcriptional regulator n=1 Tax=Actinoplanes lutulentus TaxID=1287878 RepID=A0A327Z1T7_9ACTN|nr:TetR/AcrR family transcriptional regulator [Actinoplanes lutulentus]MBB2943346.1 AcrR family transcriptional regulator [Actinoplanes lutulentus]RAK28405.1 TetR family transcriptional regulator [Actinoplanes lutulentus]
MAESGRGRGRPRSEQARHAILAAARDLIAEAGYEQLTVQAIAARAGSGRQTVYRWWRSKELIVAELVTSGELTLPAVPIPDTGHLEPDLIAWLDTIVHSLEDPQAGGLMLALVTAASDNEADARLLYEMSTGPFHRALVARLTQGAAAGQVGPHADTTAIADALIGTVLFRALTPGARPAPTSAVIRTLLGCSTS